MKFVSCSTIAVVAIAASAVLTPVSLAQQSAAPVVKGPESVQDWFQSGQQFIEDARHDTRRINRHAKNVILFVGDGLGVSTASAARILEGQMNGKPGEENQLFFEKLPFLALSKTYSWDQQTPDSAPTMTAMVTGYKAREGMLAVDHTTSRLECDAQTIASKSLATILEQAAYQGKDTGVVSTARITHATPAANYAHTAVRDWESDAEIRSHEKTAKLAPGACGVKDIARQMIEVSDHVKRSLKVALGGGRPYFISDKLADPEDPTATGRRKDGRDLTAEWVSSRGKKAAYVWNKSQFDAATPANTDYLLGLFERSHMQFEADRAKDVGGEPSLTEMTEKAIDLLAKNHKGFYLHVESGRIDHAHHAGNPYRALTDTIEFAKAIKKAYEMTDPKETLIIITADHSHVFTIAGYPHRGNPILGKVAEVPNKDGEPTELAQDLLGLPYTTLSYANGPGYTGASDAQPAGIKTFPHNPKTFTNGAARPDLTNVDTTTPAFMPEATVPLGSETHSGEDVAIYAIGPKAHLVHGVMEQHFIYHVMKEAFGF
ncbi:MAG: alkaline phosphatase [Burkholderiales bacterium]|nr:alkaline phosphatase [Burkholderiales bacterium]MDQ3195154.1 alkaline phosphatase [Pseudomonadota bacterium]